MLTLRGITPLDIAQRRISLDDTGANEIVQSQKILVVAQAVEVATAPGQGAEVLSDGSEEGFGRGDAQGDFGRVGAFGVVRCFHLDGGLVFVMISRGKWFTYIIADVAFACAAEGFNGKSLAFFHFGLIAALDDGHGLAAVDGVVSNGMAVQVADAFHWEHLALDFDLVALHDFLDRCANIAHADVDAGFFDTSVGGGFAGFDEVVVDRIEGEGEGAVDDAAVDVHAEVDLHDILVVEDHLVACVGRVMRCAVVDAESGGETHAGYLSIAIFKALVACQCAHRVLDALSDLGQAHSRLDPLLSPLPYLAVDFGALAVVGEEVVVHAVEMALLLAGGAVRILV